MGVILRSPAVGGTTKNLIVTRSAEILRLAQNDMEEFPDGNYLVGSYHQVKLFGQLFKIEIT